jgi:TP901 family phage tail tape measure protein
MSLNVGNLVATLGLDKTGFDTGIDGATAKTGSFASGFASKLTSLAVPIAAVGAAAAAAVGVAVSKFGDFEQGMNQVFTLLPDASAEMRDQMVTDVRKISSEMGALTSQTIPALYDAIGSGVPPENVFSFLETAQKAAVGGVTDLGTTVDGLTSVVNAYGADVLDVATASDIMFQTVNVGKVSFKELAGSLYNVSPTAAALGVEFGEIGAAIAAMTAQGVPASVATTYLRQMLVQLSEAGTETSDLFKELSGKSFRDFVAGGGTVQQALQLLEKHANETNVGINDLFGSVWAGSAALTLTGKGTEAFTEALATMESAAGATDSAYEIMEQGLNRRIEKITVRIETKLAELGEKFMPLVEDYIMPAIEAAVDGFGKFVDWVGESGVIEQILVPAVDAAAKAFEGLNTWIQESGVVDTYLLPALDRAKQGFGDLMSGVQNFDADSSPLFQHMMTAFEPVVVFYQEQLAKLGEWWEENGETIQKALENVWAAISWVLDQILTLFEWVWPYLEQIISGNLDAALGVVKLFASILAGDWESAGDALVDISLGIMKALEGLFALGFDAIATGVEWVMNGIAEFMTDIWKGIVQAVEDSINAMIDRINGFIQGINSVTEKVGISLPTIGHVSFDASAIEAPTFTANRWADLKSTAGIPDWDTIEADLKVERESRSEQNITINQTINTQSQSATEVADATKRGLRDAALEGSL